MNLIDVMKLVILLKLWPADEVDTIRRTRSEKINLLGFSNFPSSLTDLQSHQYSEMWAKFQASFQFEKSEMMRK